MPHACPRQSRTCMSGANNGLRHLSMRPIEPAAACTMSSPHTSCHTQKGVRGVHAPLRLRGVRERERGGRCVSVRASECAHTHTRTPAHPSARPSAAQRSVCQARQEAGRALTAIMCAALPGSRRVARYGVAEQPPVLTVHQAHRRLLLCRRRLRSVRHTSAVVEQQTHTDRHTGTHVLTHTVALQP